MFDNFFIIYCAFNFFNFYFSINRQFVKFALLAQELRKKDLFPHFVISKIRLFRILTDFLSGLKCEI